VAGPRGRPRPTRAGMHNQTPPGMAGPVGSGRGRGPMGRRRASGGGSRPRLSWRLPRPVFNLEHGRAGGGSAPCFSGISPSGPGTAGPSLLSSRFRGVSDDVEKKGPRAVSGAGPLFWFCQRGPIQVQGMDRRFPRPASGPRRSLRPPGTPVFFGRKQPPPGPRARPSHRGPTGPGPQGLASWEGTANQGSTFPAQASGPAGLAPGNGAIRGPTKQRAR